MVLVPWPATCLLFAAGTGAMCGCRTNPKGDSRQAEQQSRPASGEAPQSQAVATNSPLVVHDGHQVHFPGLEAIATPGRPKLLTLTIVRKGEAGERRVLRYRSPGCGETMDLRTGVARLGCPGPQSKPGRPLDTFVDVTLDTFIPGQGYERTRLRPGDGIFEAQLLSPGQTEVTTVALWAGSRGHLLNMRSLGPSTVEAHRVFFEVKSGSFSLSSDHTGGGPYRAGQIMQCRFDGQIAYRNGQLLFASGAHGWDARVDSDLHTNDGVEMQVAFDRAPRRLEWIEVDGRYRRSEDSSLQHRFDQGAPDPAAPRGGLGAEIQRLASQAFKKIARGMRAEGPVEEVERRARSLQPGAQMVEATFRRRPTETERIAARESTVKVYGLILDTALFRLDLVHPCNLETSAFAVINGFTFDFGTHTHEVLPDTGLIIDGTLHAKLRTNPWYGNLIVDRRGGVRVEGADAFYRRHGMGLQIRHLLQGTVYVRGGRSVRRKGDNPEINWRSAVGVRTGPSGDQIIFAHTRVPPSPFGAAAAYGSGVTQYEMARFLVTLGVDEALILDGGPSAAFRVQSSVKSGGLRPTPVCLTARTR
ncbi:phosphodiester glycosidase family protein [Myxococcota bacterium]